MTLEEMLQQTGARQHSFRLMIEHIKKIPNPVIVETGCARTENNFHGDGMSTLIFDNYINTYNGEFYSVDISPNSVNFAKSKISTKTQIHCRDSVGFLYELNNTFRNQNKFVDLLYLDSFDFDKSNPHPSSVHHLKELVAIMGSLKSGTMIAVDDNFGDSFNRNGKGMYVEEFMKAIDRPLIHDGYQLVWIL